MNQSVIRIPEEVSLSGQLVLHACCAPCSTAIVEWLLAHEIRPIVFYYNPNIYPYEEYELRKEESKRHAKLNGIEWYDGDWEHAEWVTEMCGHENDPERGARCSLCFGMRLRAAAAFARKSGILTFATTLASSRWKNIVQVNQAGEEAGRAESVRFWAQNWRRGGLQERRNELLREGRFYNQRYCGCEYSLSGVAERTSPTASVPTPCDIG